MTLTLLTLKVACKCVYREDRTTSLDWMHPVLRLEHCGSSLVVRFLFLKYQLRLEITCQPSAAVRGFNNSMPRKTTQHTSNRMILYDIISSIHMQNHTKNSARNGLKSLISYMISYNILDIMYDITIFRQYQSSAKNGYR